MTSVCPSLGVFARWEVDRKFFSLDTHMSFGYIISVAIWL